MDCFSGMRRSEADAHARSAGPLQRRLRLGRSDARIPLTGANEIAEASWLSGMRMESFDGHLDAAE